MSVLRNQDRVLELSGPLSVASHRRPVVLPQLISPSALVYHRLYGENVPWTHDSHGFVLSVVRDGWGAVEKPPDAVAAVGTNDGKAVCFRVSTNDISHVFVHFAGTTAVNRLH